MKYFTTLLTFGVFFLSSLIISLLCHDEQVALGQYPAINGIKCDKTEHFNFHYHAHLDIFINGVSYTVPAGIGIKPAECIYWLHTHDISGIIHVESPDNRSFTLGQFFDIWGKKFNNTQIFDFAIDNTQNQSLAVYINGTKVNSQYPDIPLHNHQYITIVYGKHPSEIPVFEFPY
jgi:hypothetical protein